MACLHKEIVAELCCHTATISYEVKTESPYTFIYYVKF